MNKNKIYVFIREDLTPEQKIVQVGHICYEAGSLYGLPPHLHLILGGVKDKEELYKIEHKLNKNNIKYEIFFEPDNEMGHTAICTEPMNIKRLNGIKLYKEKSHQI